jgi:gluconate 5-dehydrogenase
VRALPYAVDVSQEDEVERLMTSARDELGAIDVLVNGAATFWSAPAEDVPLERGWQRVLDVNLTGTFLACRAAGRAMLRAGRGSMINVAATGGIKSFAPELGPNLSYMTSKAAVIKLTRDLAAQWANRGVRVNAIAPGSIAGGMMRSLPEDKLAPMVAAIPMRRQGRPDELRGAVAYLASDASSYVTGAVLVVDGGQSIV